ncbi:hypothetical protein U1Q18_035194 [Sarracenia purpurea var. burkii]
MVRLRRNHWIRLKEGEEVQLGWKLRSRASVLLRWGLRRSSRVLKGIISAFYNRKSQWTAKSVLNGVERTYEEVIRN